MGLELEAWAIGILMGAVATAKIIAAHPNLIDMINSFQTKKEKPKKENIVKTIGKLEGKAAPLPEFKQPDTSELDRKIEKSL